MKGLTQNVEKMAIEQRKRLGTKRKYGNDLFTFLEGIKTGL